MEDYKPITIIGATREYKHVDSETEAINNIIDDLGIDRALFKVVKPCNDYSTVRYNNEEIDLFRIKYTDNSKWIGILTTPDIRKKYNDDPLFDAQKNKNKVLWKSNIKNLHDYKNIILEVIDFRDKQKKN